MTEALTEHTRLGGKPALLVAWVLALPTFAVATHWVSTHGESLLPALLEIAPWVVVAVASDLMSVPLWRGMTFSLSLPVLLAAGYVFEPSTAAVIALLGYADAREFRGTVTIRQGAINRGQMAMSAFGASLAFHSIVGSSGSDVVFVCGVLAAIAVDFLVNFSVVSFVTGRVSETSLREVVVGLTMQSPFRFMWSYLCLGLMSAVLALLYWTSGLTGLLLGLSPLFVAGQMLSRSREALEAMESSQRRQAGLVAATRRMADERQDERRVLAGSLHDEVLPPIYQVHLMGEVVRRDLESGALLELEQDVPRLLDATTAASDAIRGLIGDLRKSQLGPGGMLPTLRQFVTDIEGQNRGRVGLCLDDVPSNPLIELVAYQVAREGIVNALRHGGATQVDVECRRLEGGFQLTVKDNGGGFEVEAGSPEGHFGLVLMRERLEAVGGSLEIKSTIGVGTMVRALLPESSQQVATGRES